MKISPEQNSFWSQLDNIVAEHTNSSHILLLGDINARLDEQLDAEQDCIGPHVWGKRRSIDDPLRDNAVYLLDFLQSHILLLPLTFSALPSALNYARVGVLFGYFLVLVGGSLFQCVEKTASSQSVSRSAKCSVSQPVTSPPSQPASSQSVSQSSATWPASSQSVSQPASQPVSQSVNRSLRHGASQSVKQSVSQSANQPASEALRSVQLSCASHYEDRA